MTRDEIIEMATQVSERNYGRIIFFEFEVEELEAFAKLVAAKAIAELENQEPVKYEHKTYTMPVCPKCRSFFCDHTCKAIAELESQEPVADDFFKMIANKNPKPFLSPQRTWIGLTDDEFNELYERYVPLACYALLIEKVEAKLKQKNGYFEDKNT
jgi:hypothetical protein